jgi:hypothetical protein
VCKCHKYKKGDQGPDHNTLKLVQGNHHLENTNRKKQASRQTRLDYN